MPIREQSTCPSWIAFGVITKRDKVCAFRGGHFVERVSMENRSKKSGKAHEPEEKL
jgi:hypothetical protein